MHKPFFLRGNCSNTYPDVVCRGNYSRDVLETPLLYDLNADPGELYPLDIKDPQYAEVFQKIQTVSGTLLGLFVWSDRSWCFSDEIRL